MGTNISKQGIAFASGNIGANLLPHTDVATYGTGYLASYSSGTFSVDNTVLFNGKPTIKIKPSSSSTSSGATNRYNTDSVALTSGVKYCYSAWVLTDVADEWNISSLGHFQTATSSASHNRTINFSGVSVPANKWTWVYQIFTPTANCVFRSYHIYFANTSQTLWISDVKLEQGEFPTLWCPNVNDTTFVGNTSGFNEVPNPSISKANYFSANQFIEL